MRIIPLVSTWNHLQMGSDAGDSRRYSRGAPLANAVNDFRSPLLGRGTFRVQAGVNDDVDFNEGAGELNATLTAASYWTPAQYIQHVAAQMTATGTHSYTGLWLQDATNRYRFRIVDNTGTVTLLVKTGTNGTDNLNTAALHASCGFGAYDRSAAATHTGDIPVVHDPTEGTRVARSGVDGAARCVVCVNPIGSPGTRARAVFSSVSPSRRDALDASDLMVGFFDAVESTGPTGMSFEVVDAHCELRQLVGFGYGYVGDYWEPTNAWRERSYSLDPLLTAIAERNRTGRSIITAEYGERYEVSLAWDTQPGFEPADVPVLRSLVSDLGVGSALVVCLDAAYPVDSSVLVRLTQPPVLEHTVTDGEGLYSFKLEAVTVSVS